MQAGKATMCLESSVWLRVHLYMQHYLLSPKCVSLNHSQVPGTIMFSGPGRVLTLLHTLSASHFTYKKKCWASHSLWPRDLTHFTWLLKKGDARNWERGGHLCQNNFSLA